MLAMVILLVIIVVTFIVILGGGLVLLQLFSQNQPVAQIKSGAPQNPLDKPENKIGFRWSYIVLPLVILLISIGISIYFYAKLPDPLNYRLSADNSPASMISRNGIMLWAILPQFLLTLFTFIIAYGTTRISHLFAQAATAGVKLDTILLIMSNMVVIPQLVLLFTMLNIFRYDSSQTSIDLIWWVSLAIIIVGLVFLGIFFVRTIRKLGRPAK
jgi:TRAP-type C4-dicarboxylate transport system permease small subunit